VLPPSPTEDRLAETIDDRFILPNGIMKCLYKLGKGSLNNGYVDNGFLNKYEKNLKIENFYEYVLLLIN
jgi:hypothetical protein